MSEVEMASTFMGAPFSIDPGLPPNTYRIDGRYFLTQHNGMEGAYEWTPNLWDHFKMFVRRKRAAYARSEKGDDRG